MRSLETLPQSMRLNNANLIHLIEVELCGRTLEGAVAWYDCSVPKRKLIQICLFDFPISFSGPLVALEAEINTALWKLRPILSPATTEYRAANSFYDPARRYEDMETEAVTAIFDLQAIVFEEDIGPICGHLSSHEILKLLTRPDMLSIRGIGKAPGL